MSARDFLWYARRLVALAVALFGVFFFMFYSDVIGRAFQSVARLEADPKFTGGRVAMTAYDPVGDDHGFGSLSYPTHPDFSDGALDLIRYTVHEPVYGAQWSESPEYWQIDLAFASAPQSARNIRIYVDADGDGIGKAEPRDEMAEGVSFDPAFPWDYAIAVAGSSGELVSADGNVTVPVSVTLGGGGKDVSLRVPLSDRRLVSLFAAETTAQYVCVGGWSPWGRDGYLPVASRAASGTGGGATSSLAPKIYDCLAPEGTSQEGMLSSWDEDTLTVPVLYPVIVPMRAAGDGAAVGAAISLPGLGNGSRAERIASLQKEAEAESQAAKATARALWTSSQGVAASDRSAHVASAEIAVAVLAFEAGLRAEAESAFDRILARDREDATALAYKGSLVALRASEAAPLAAVEIVSESFRYLDRAVSLAQTPDERLAALLNRANVSLSVPESVFGKALAGAGDFLAAAEGYRARVPRPEAELATAYLGAARCFEAGGRDGDAGTWYREAARIVRSLDETGVEGVPAALRLELLTRGYLDK